MIKRQSRSEPLSREPEAPSEPFELIGLVDLDFNFGKDDTESLVLYPGDRLNADLPDKFVIDIVENTAYGRVAEHLEISRAFVRGWSRRERTFAVPRSFDPAVTK